MEIISSASFCFFFESKGNSLRVLVSEADCEDEVENRFRNVFVLSFRLFWRDGSACTCPERDRTAETVRAFGTNAGDGISIKSGACGCWYFVLSGGVEVRMWAVEFSVKGDVLVFFFVLLTVFVEGLILRGRDSGSTSNVSTSAAEGSSQHVVQRKSAHTSCGCDMLHPILYHAF